MLTFKQESVDVWARDAKDLYVHHWQELGLDLDLKIEPDVEKMKLMENIGMWKVLTVRNDNQLVGYLLAVFSKHLHYASSPPMFIIDAYYVAPEFRNGTGVKLIRYAEKMAKALGSIKIYLTCKVHQDHSKLFVRLGYKLSDYAFVKRI